MSVKVYYDFDDLQKQVVRLARKILLSKYDPDFIVGITRGGLIPGTLLSHFLKKPMYTLDVSLRDKKEMGLESNTWMAEMAYGYDVDDGAVRKNILIVDDINDSGATINWIKNDWRSGCYPNSLAWDNEIWHKNVRFACLVDNCNSDATIDYSAIQIAKTEEYSPWIVFPWEQDD
jgi:hypoxanthine phosphoribosyltransferase